MTMLQNGTLLAVFDRRGEAEGAIDELRHAGFAKDEVGLLGPGPGVVQTLTPTEYREETAANGAVFGAAAGCAAGAVTGALVAVLVPGLGTLLAGGLLVGLGALAGAAGGAYVGPFLSMGMSEPEAPSGEPARRTGRTLVFVKPGPRTDQAKLILHGHGAVLANPADE